MLPLMHAALFARRCRSGSIGSPPRCYLGSRSTSSAANDGDELSLIAELSDAEPQAPTGIARLALIRIEMLRGKPGNAAPGYPREWLEPLARELARQLSTLRQSSFGEAIEQPIAVVPVEVADDARPIERLDRPAGSQIVMQQTADSLTFEIPPLGFRGLVKGMLIFACVWLAFPALFTIMVFIAKQPPGQPGGRLGALAFIGVFWLIGAGIMLLAIHVGFCDGRLKSPSPTENVW